MSSPDSTPSDFDLEALQRLLLQAEGQPSADNLAAAAAAVAGLLVRCDGAARELVGAMHTALEAARRGVPAAGLVTALVDALDLLPGGEGPEAAALADRLRKFAAEPVTPPAAPLGDWPRPGGPVEVSLLRQFATEAAEHLQDAEGALLQLEQEPDARFPVHRLFRAVHSLKGTAGYLGLAQLETFAHRLEGALLPVRQGQALLGRRRIDLLFRGVDELKAMVADLTPEGEKARDPSGFLEALTEVDAVVATEEPTAAVGDESKPDLGEVVAALLALAGGDHSEATLQRLQQAATALQITAQAAGRPGEADPAACLARAASGLLAAQGRLREEVATGYPPPPAVAAAAPPAPAAVAVAAPEPAPPSRAAQPPAAEATRAGAAVRSLRVDQGKLDEYVNLAGELVIARNALAHDFRLVQEGRSSLRRLEESVNKMKRVVADIQSNAMSMRMAPVASLFQRFPRLVRDLARTLDKEIALVTEGETTELDRQLAEALADPLIHLVRNSADHGIETPADRRAAGKPAEGTIRLRAGRDGNLILLDVEDDGGGIDRQRLRAKAVASGLLTAEQADALSEEQALDLVFAPGLSTARQVTDLSGRGVGMDVVRSNITRLGGSVRLDSEPGRGTHVRLQLPLTLAVTTVILAEAGGSVYGLPIEAIRETVKTRPEGLQRLCGHPALTLRGEVVPLRSLAAVLEGRRESPGEEVDQDEAGWVRVLVVRGHAGVFGLTVDGLRGQQEVVLKPMPDRLSRAASLAGATILGDGSVVLILDPKALAG